MLSSLKPALWLLFNKPQSKTLSHPQFHLFPHSVPPLAPPRLPHSMPTHNIVLRLARRVFISSRCQLCVFVSLCRLRSVPIHKGQLLFPNPPTQKMPLKHIIKMSACQLTVKHSGMGHSSQQLKHSVACGPVVF